MKAVYQLILFLFLPLVHHGQSASLPEIINKIESLPEIKRQKASTELLQSYSGPVPYVTDDRAFFLYTGSADRVSVPGDFNGWSPTADPMTNIKGTDVWYLYKTFDPAARLDYKLSVNQDAWILDPRNPDQMMGGFGPNSSISMPLYRASTDFLPQEDIVKGTLHEVSLHSEFTGKSYRIRVYLPAGYNDSTTSHPTVYFNDGNDYLVLGKAKTILDKMIYDGDIPPAVAVFIDPNDRMAEYGGADSETYTKFVVKELLNWVASTYPGVSNRSENRIMVGTSLGGNITTLIAYQNPFLFGKAGIHSPAYGYGDKKALKLLRSLQHTNVSGYYVIGTYEGWDPGELQDISKLIVSSKVNGKLIKAPQGHNWGLWRDTLGDMLKYLMAGLN